MADDLIKPALAAGPSAPEADVANRSPRAQARNAELLAAALATIAGFTDAYGMITYGVFVSFMSGNTTQTGYKAAEGLFGAAALSGLAILFFVIGSFAATLLVQSAGRLARRVVFGVVAAGLATIIGFTEPQFAVRRRRDRSHKFHDGRDEQRVLPRRRAVREPHLRDRNAEPCRLASGACRAARASQRR